MQVKYNKAEIKRGRKFVELYLTQNGGKLQSGEQRTRESLALNRMLQAPGKRANAQWYGMVGVWVKSACEYYTTSL